MSVYAMSIVWKSGAYEQGTLLVLLAMADFADDEGGSVFPTVRTLCKKSRLSERQVRTCIAQLKDDGAIQREEGDPTKTGAMRYRVNLDRLGAIAGRQGVQKLQGGIPVQSTAGEGVQPTAETPCAPPHPNKHQSNNLNSNHQHAPDGAQGAGKAGKAEKEKKPKAGVLTKIGDFRPGPHDRELAIAYWNKNGRPDLIARIEDVVDHFCDHHRGAGSRKEDWPATWRTWYANQLSMTRPPRDVPRSPKLAAAGGVTVEQWIYRWRCWCLGIPDEGIYGEERPKGFWDKAWGPKPGQKAFDAPMEAWAEFKKRFPNAA